MCDKDRCGSGPRHGICDPILRTDAHRPGPRVGVNDRLQVALACTTHSIFPSGSTVHPLRQNPAGPSRPRETADTIEVHSATEVDLIVVAVTSSRPDGAQRPDQFVDCRAKAHPVPWVVRLGALAGRAVEVGKELQDSIDAASRSPSADVDAPTSAGVRSVIQNLYCKARPLAHSVLNRTRVRYTRQPWHRNARAGHYTIANGRRLIDGNLLSAESS